MYQNHLEELSKILLRPTPLLPTGFSDSVGPEGLHFYQGPDDADFADVGTTL